jgi:hypothetical protein
MVQLIRGLPRRNRHRRHLLTTLAPLLYAEMPMVT